MTFLWLCYDILYCSFFWHTIIMGLLLFLLQNEAKKSERRRRTQDDSLSTQSEWSVLFITPLYTFLCKRGRLTYIHDQMLTQLYVMSLVSALPNWDMLVFITVVWRADIQSLRLQCKHEYFLSDRLHLVSLFHRDVPRCSGTTRRWESTCIPTGPVCTYAQSAAKPS